MVKQRDEHSKFQGVKLRVIFGKKNEVIQLLGKSTAYSMGDKLAAKLWLSQKICNAIELQLFGKMDTTIWFELIRTYDCPWKTRCRKNGNRELLGTSIFVSTWLMCDLIVSLDIPN